LRKATSPTSIASKALPSARAVLPAKTALRAAEIVVDVLRDAVDVADQADAVAPAAVVVDAVRVAVVVADAAGSRNVSCRKRGLRESVAPFFLCPCSLLLRS
jgi:hypothetical protein